MKKAANTCVHYSISDWIGLCHQRSIDNHWWTYSELEYQPPLVMAAKIALIHSEVSEMLEGLRTGEQDKHLNQHLAEHVEAADIFIRLMDYCGARGIDLQALVPAKMLYNQTRADHQPDARGVAGGKKF